MNTKTIARILFMVLVMVGWILLFCATYFSGFAVTVCGAFATIGTAGVLAVPYVIEAVREVDKLND